MLRALTFGQCAFETPVARIAPDSEVHFGLLLSIVSAPADGVARDEVVSRLWPRAAGEDGRHCLRQAMYRLRQLGVSVQLNAGRIVLHDARSALDVHSLLYGTPTQAELVRLGAMSFLPSYEPSLGEPFDHWLETLRERVAMRLCRALADEVASTRSRGRFHDMGHVARALLVLDPLNELATMVLAESLALQGSKVEALRLLEEYEVEVGAVNRNLQLPARVLRRRVAEVLDDGLQLRQFEVPFVGREREFCALRTLWRDVRGGHARAVIVSGEAGIGKSRLAGELVRLAALDGGRVARYTTSAGDSFTPISTLVSVGQQLLTLPGALGCAAEQLSYIRRLGTPESVSAWSVAGMAADVLYAQLVHAFAELVSAIAEEAPLIISVDDAERLHPTTWRVLVDIWDRVGRRGVLFLLAARRLPPWFGSLGTRSCERLTQHLPIAAFSREESHEFVHAWSAQNRTTVSDGMVALLASISRGNPFYLTELAAHVGHGGDPDQTPSTILDLIGAQCRVLSKEAHRVLVVIAVLESRATTARVTRVLEQPASDFMAALDELEEAGLVTTQGPAVRVRHRLVDEVARSLAMPSVVDFAHGRAAAVLESEADATLSVELLGDCVTHWERAGETRRAYEAAMKLGYRLVGLGMGEEAERAFVRAEGLCDGPEERALSLKGRIVATFLAGRWADVGVLASERTCILSTTAPSSSGFDEMELLAAEARLFSADSAPNTNRLSEIIESTSLSPRTRLRAAVLLAILADNLFDVPLLKHAFEASSELLTGSEADAAVLQLIFPQHTRRPPEGLHNT
ncbi:MAG: AAA family ATPase [Gemmatimonadetes bacterium]|nr:AAA family ATPase [Gemmatimonadota bacterium]